MTDPGGPEELEVMEMALVRKVYNGSYSHAENLLIALNALTAEVGYEIAVEQLHERIVINNEQV